MVKDYNGNVLHAGDRVRVSNPNAKKVKYGDVWYVSKINSTRFGENVHLCAVFPWVKGAVGVEYVNPNNLTLETPANGQQQPQASPPAQQPANAYSFNPGDAVQTLGPTLPKGWPLLVVSVVGNNINLVSKGGSKYSCPLCEVSLVSSAPAPQQQPSTNPTAPTAQQQPTECEILDDTQLSSEDLADIARAEELTIAEQEGRLMRGVVDPLGRVSDVIVVP